MNNMLMNVKELPVALQNQMQAELEKSKGVSAGISSGAALPRLSIAGKEFSVRIGGQSQPLRTFTLDVIIADSRPGISKLYYEKTYDPSNVAGTPDCASIDGITPDFKPAIIDKETGACPHNCRDCYFNKFGTATQGKGKACKDYKRVVVLLAGTDQNPFDPARPPLALDIPATSFRAPRDAAGVMMFKEFTEACERNNMPVSMVVAELSFMSGTAFSQLCMRPKRMVTEAEYNRVLEVRNMEDVVDALTDKYEPREEDLPEETQEALATPAPAQPAVSAPVAPTPVAPAPAQPAPVVKEEPKVGTQPDLFASEPTPAVKPTPVEVNSAEAEAVAQLDAFFATL